MNHRHPIAVLAAGAILTLAACGTAADQSPASADAPADAQHVAAWQAYDDATHTPHHPTSPHVHAWQAYDDATH